jgi:CHASE3 domain sensor protein
VLLAVVAWNAYLAVHQMRRMQSMAALLLESSAIQKNISDVVKDLIDMETSQRGYLLTGDSAYLQPYTDATGRIGIDLAGLRVGLSKRVQHEQSLESQLESLAASKQSEMERTISLRQHGYRHRSFMLVGTDEGKEYMDEIRGVALSLSSAVSGNLAKLDKERSAAMKRGLSMTLLGNASLFVIAGCLFMVIRRQYGLIENEAFQNRRELASRDVQLERLASALSGQARSEIIAMNTTSRLLLENYSGFLPTQGHEYAEQMKEAAVQIERLRQDLVGSLECEGNGRVA